MKIGLKRNLLCPRKRASRRSIALICLVLMLCAPLVAWSNEHDDEVDESEESEDRVAELEAQLEAMRNAAVTNAIKRIAASGQAHRCSLDTFCNPGSGVDYSSVSMTHNVGYRHDGENLVHAIPWRGDDGQVEFVINITPEALHRGHLEFWLTTELRTDADRMAGRATHGLIEDHGLGTGWQGFEAVKTYDGGGTLTVRFFTDLSDDDDPLAPYTNQEFDAPAQEILLTDDRIPYLTGRDFLYFEIPEDGLQGTLDGVAGTFTCPEHRCSFLTNWAGPGYVPWADSAPVLFTPDGEGLERSIRPTHHVSSSDEVPKVNYLSLGSWLYVPEVGAEPDDYRFGIFAGGDDGFAGANLPGLSGTARYVGKATGMLAEKVTLDTFSADAEFMADFDTTSETGAIGSISGSVSNFALGSGNPSPLSELTLGADETGNIWPGWPWSDESISGGFIDGGAWSEDGWHGRWEGKFYGNDDADPTAHPTSFAGVFGATDGGRHIAGSFGTHKE